MATTSTRSTGQDRVSTHIEGLDSQLQGGIPRKHIVLLCGSAGTMKSSIAFNILYHECLTGKNSLYVSLEQGSESLLSHMENLGMDLSKVNLLVLSDITKMAQMLASIDSHKTGNLIVADISALRKQVQGVDFAPSADWLNVLKNIVIKLKEKGAIDNFVLDSLSALYVLSNFDHPRNALFHIFEFLRDQKITSFLLSEMPLDKSEYSEFEVEDYLCDGIILLQLTERHRKTTRELTIVKMRGVKCNTDVWSLEAEDGKFKVLYGGQSPLV